MSTTYRLSIVQHFHSKHTVVEVDDLFPREFQKCSKKSTFKALNGSKIYHPSASVCFTLTNLSSLVVLLLKYNATYV